MKMLSREELVKEAGTPLFQNRDFSLYDGAPFDCACGSVHSFNQYGNTQHFASTGGSAKFMVECPQNGNVLTLIKTKNKLFIMFDRFVSLAGHTGDVR
ncbi:hypothetical protein ACMC9M_11390 [Pseudomonadota bacterium 24LQ007]|jgi:hypothetical protein|uniref:hypothetical protein n=1 Tax=Marinobacter sp. ST-43 TaxID=3050453 RepID=UPI0026E0767D|nr:hypothetical protein [Marinobacter sp. ST-43]